MSQHDPVARRIISIALGLIILWLAGVVSALLFGMMDPTAPRTSTERALKVYESVVESGEANPTVYAAYIRALTEAGQYTRAQQLINASVDADESTRAQILVEQARLHNARNRHESAIETVDEALAQFEADWARIEAAAKERNVPVTEQRPIEHRQALILKAAAFDGLKQPDKALEIYSDYLEIWPADADVRTLRGDIYAEQGDNDQAEADYREALRYIPDYEAALEGLDTIGATR
jgi:tetratricopeptide (TPR) repeat protein